MVDGNRGKDGNLYYPQIENNVLMYSNSSVYIKTKKEILQRQSHLWEKFDE